MASTDKPAGKSRVFQESENFSGAGARSGHAKVSGKRIVERNGSRRAVFHWMTQNCSDETDSKRATVRRMPQPDAAEGQFHACGVSPAVLKSTMPRDELIPTRASLLERLKDLGDQGSWNEFYQTYRELIYSVARRAGLNETDADEVVQETVIAVARKMPGFRYDPAVDSFKGWLLTVTRWRILDQLQKRQQMANQSLPKSARRQEDQTRTGTVERVPDPARPDLAAIWDEEWERNLVQAALARIKRQVHPQQYEIYHLHMILERPVREVAHTLGVNAGQVYLAKHRVGSLLKKEIRRLRQARP
jgi:RNA polymerase sigma factor (sigma-70 family)